MGAPLPGETALVVAATYAGHTHRLSPWLVFLAASAGAIIGDNIGFWLGEKGGYPLARRYGSKVGLNERKLKTARYLFDSHGIKVVVHPLDRGLYPRRLHGRSRAIACIRNNSPIPRGCCNPCSYPLDADRAVSC